MTILNKDLDSFSDVYLKNLNISFDVMKRLTMMTPSCFVLFWNGKDRIEYLPNTIHTSNCCYYIQLFCRLFHTKS